LKRYSNQINELSWRQEQEIEKSMKNIKNVAALLGLKSNTTNFRHKKSRHTSAFFKFGAEGETRTLTP
jgi:hypothetical protein